MEGGRENDSVLSAGKPGRGLMIVVRMHNALRAGEKCSPRQHVAAAACASPDVITFDDMASAVLSGMASVGSDGTRLTKRLPLLQDTAQASRKSLWRNIRITACVIYLGERIGCALC